jgi:N-acetylmuramoyl-L-alanine amidase
MSEMPVVVLDPGHGGARGSRNRGSSWNRAEGPNGLLEKDVVFDLAVRVAQRLRNQARVELTRAEDANPSLTERAAVAKRLNAALFLSLHLNGSSDADANGTDVYIAHDAGHPARAFGDAVLGRLRTATGTTRGGLGARDFGTIVTKRHHPRTASCLAEIAYLTNPQQARSLAEEGYRNHIAEALADAIRAHIAPRALASGLDFGDGSPFAGEALAQCWQRCEQLRLGASNAAAPNRAAAQRIRSESGVVADANPYYGIGQNEIDAVVRACFNARAMPEVLLALWAKEGSTRSITTPVVIAQASSDANARAIFRSKVYYEDLGADHFLVTTRAGSGSDNVFDDSDTAAGRHETHFAQKVAELVTGRFLSENVAGAINGELTVSRVNGRRAVLPSMRFYALSLLLVDALWARFQAATRPLLPSISDPMNYLQWNMGTASFDAFLRSAEAHRREPRHRANGEPIAIDRWALHTSPAANEYRQPRLNAIKFMHYIESYRPIFGTWLNLIKPGIEDLRPNPKAADVAMDDAPVEALAPPPPPPTAPTFASVNRVVPTTLPGVQRFVRLPITFDESHGPFGAATLTTRIVATEAAIRADFAGFSLIALPAPNSFIRVDNVDQIARSPFFQFRAGNIEVALDSIICFPADPARTTQLAPSRTKFPIAIVVHGNHNAFEQPSTFTPTGPAQATTLPGGPPPVTVTVTPARLPFTQVHSHLGYCQDATRTEAGATNGGTPYLQESLAQIGIVSMSVSTNGANQFNIGIPFRAEYIMQYLDQLRRLDADRAGMFHNRLDFDRVALIGHSRGGDAVVQAIQLNARRPGGSGVGKRCNIRAVVTIAPTDMSGILSPTGSGAHPATVARPIRYLCIYGAHDADVRGGGDGAHDTTASGFRIYDRANTAERAMVFIHGANHNRFNRVWDDEGDAIPPPATFTRRQQETLASEYISAWLRYGIYSDPRQLGLFNGTTANSLRKPVSLMWSFGQRKEIETHQDTDARRNTLTGTVAAPAYVSEVALDGENPPDPVLPGTRLPTFPHVHRVGKANPVAAPRAPLRQLIPAAHANFGAFTHLTFRIAKLYPTATQAVITGSPFPNFTITLEDTATPPHRHTITNAAILAANPLAVKPYFRALDDTTVSLRNITKCNLETWRVPLSLFTTGAPVVTLRSVRAIEFDFDAAAGQPIYVDTLTLVNIT